MKNRFEYSADVYCLHIKQFPFDELFRSKVLETVQLEFHACYDRFFRYLNENTEPDVNTYLH